MLNKLKSRFPNPVAGARCSSILPIIGCFIILLQACIPMRWEGNTTSSQARATNNGAQRSRGNPASYEVFGRRYYVLDTSHGYKERGVASWYGRKFHGKPTSSGEIYDMHAMTAAHKTLPLPTMVRVTNLRNGRSVIVDVNDRGPFVHNRIIDLSYSAARQLDMIGSGTALVEVETLGATPQVAPLMASISGEATESPAVNGYSGDIDGQSDITRTSASVSAAKTVDVYLQIGAFGEHLNARQLQQQLQTSGIFNVVIRYDVSSEPALYRVRLGPIGDVDEYDALLEKLAIMQIKDTHLVTESLDDQISDISAGNAGGLAGG